MPAKNDNQASLLDNSITSDIRRLEFRTRRVLGADLMGQYRSAFRGSGLIYSDLREYQPGDEIKSIHWKATARSGKVYVKSYDEDRLLNIMLLIDISRSTDYGAPRTRHQRAFEFAALIAMLAQKNEDALGLCLFSDKVHEFMRPRRSRTQFQRVVLSLLEHRELAPASRLAEAFAYTERHLRRAGIVFAVSDFHSAPFTEELRRLSYRHDVILVQLKDAVGDTLPDAGLIEYVDAESGATRLLDSSSKAARAALEAAIEKHAAQVSDVAAFAKADYMALRGNPLPPLTALMKKRASRMAGRAGSLSAGTGKPAP